jgi:hypothetical protein
MWLKRNCRKPNRLSIRGATHAFALALQAIELAAKATSPSLHNGNDLTHNNDYDPVESEQDE